MEVKILEEHGYENAIRGLAYSFKDRAEPISTWWTESKFAKMEKTALKLAHREGGHNKWVESVVLWIDIEAPRYFWSEFDTYRVGITKQSESTMHTLSKRFVDRDDFEWIDFDTLDNFNSVLEDQRGYINIIKAALPEGYLQRRMVVTNYKVLRNMIYQRENHRLPEWKTFIDEIYKQCEHPEILPNLGDK